MLSVLAEAVERRALRGRELAGITKTSIPGLSFVRVYAAGVVRHVPRRPLVRLVLQGTKAVVAGPSHTDVGAGDTSLLTVTEPSVSHIVRASRVTSYLAMTLPLDPELLMAIRLDMTALKAGSPTMATAADDQLLATALRLVQMLDNATSLPVLQASVLRELNYWLLAGRHGPALCRLVPPCAHREGVRRAVDLLRAEADAPLDLARLADVAGMELSTFRRHFRDATGLSPLQFQKRLRLHNARRLMLHEGLGAAPAAFAVGYHSPSQFTREYHRLFGVPPARDARDARRADLL